MFDSGWFELAYFVNIYHGIEEFFIQEMWIEKGISTERREQAAFGGRRTEGVAELDVYGGCPQGYLYRLRINGVEMGVD
jgi:hypothetical protein